MSALDHSDDGSVADLFQNAPCGLLSLSSTGQITVVNDTLLSWLGYGRDELVNRVRLQELMTVPGRIFYDTHFAPLLRLQGFVNEIAVDLVHKDGTTVAVFVSAMERHSDAGELTSLRVAVSQAADRRKYERELLLSRRMAEQAMKAKSDFLAMFAHDVRNPLSTVKMAAIALERSGVSPVGQRSLTILQRSLDRVLALLENMLDFSRVEAGQMTLEQQRFDLRELVHGVVQTLEPVAERKHLTIRTEIDAAVPAYLLGDGIKIGQVIANLAGNAVKFTETGAVTVSVEATGRSEARARLRFCVSDTGIGIPPDRIGRIFEEFVQAGPEITSHYGGTGLGLAISRRIVELHGGKIQAESQPGRGSVFSFELSLPIAEASRDPWQSLGAQAEGP